MNEDLDLIRMNHRETMLDVAAQMERQLFLRTKMKSVQFLNGRTTFEVTRGFLNTVMIAELLIFMDGTLLHARKELMIDKEVTFNINMRYKNLALRDGKKVCILVRDVSEYTNVLDENNLFMMNGEEGHLIPISANAYKMM